MLVHVDIVHMFKKKIVFSFKARRGLQRKICAGKTPRSVSHRGVLVNLGLSKKLAKFLKSLHIWLLVFQRYLVAQKKLFYSSQC